MPSLRALAESTGETAHLSQLVAGPLQTLASAYSARHGMQVMMEDADFLPFHATASGMAVMAFLPEPVREAILAAALYNLTRTTQTNPETLRAQLPGICATGFSESDSTKHQVIAASGSSIAEAIAAEDENIAMQAMGRGAATLCARQQREGAFDRVIVLGGSMGTDLAQLLCNRWPDPRLFHLWRQRQRRDRPALIAPVSQDPRRSGAHQISQLEKGLSRHPHGRRLGQRQRQLPHRL